MRRRCIDNNLCTRDVWLIIYYCAFSHAGIGLYEPMWAGFNQLANIMIKLPDHGPNPNITHSNTTTFPSVPTKPNSYTTLQLRALSSLILLKIPPSNETTFIPWSTSTKIHIINYNPIFTWLPKIMYQSKHLIITTLTYLTATTPSSQPYCNKIWYLLSTMQYYNTATIYIPLKTAQFTCATEAK